MKNNKVFSFIAIVLFLFSTGFFTGCQLALETTDTESHKDKLSGVFITLGESIPYTHETNHPTLEASFYNGVKLSNTNLTSTSEDKRVYGVLSEDGNSIDFHVEGYYLGFRKETLEDGAPYITSYGGEGLSDINFALNSKDDVEEIITCEATLFVGTDFCDTVRLYPIYEDNAGNYYTLLDNTSVSSFSGFTTGSVLTRSLDETTTVTYENRTITEKRAFTIRITIADEVSQLLIKEMNEKDELIKVTEYYSDSPEEFLVDSNTKYIIAEEHFTTKDKSTKINRSIYSPLPKDSNETANHYYCNFGGEEGRINRKLIKFICDQ